MPYVPLVDAQKVANRVFESHTTQSGDGYIVLSFVKWNMGSGKNI